MLPGVPSARTHDYKRAGTSSLSAALNLTTGKVIGALHSRHRAIEFEVFLGDASTARSPPSSTSTSCSTTADPQDAGDPEWLPAHPRFVLHFTPTISSWRTSWSAGSPS